MNIGTDVLRLLMSCTLLSVTTGCTSVLGIGDAHVDPALSSEGDAGEAVKPSETNGATCKHFDNVKRLQHLLPDGGLAPLPKPAVTP